ncbi:FAD-dependent monooxygenase [Kutzneria sp. CA-103260]|uniref:FAD-dependent monooxygenase n=1 Tax=Kutzneria sp. CA-103260 TaxID=2802641 RepID=UPI001BA773FB|nr:FAD-dependent monooxygenase [Kutzneria sp. CA-103260]QUQ67737.1 monooxygenase [Kutzneria sp. CA-103260]
MKGLVLGGGLAGTLAAAALAEHCDTVTVVERDRLPAGPEPRKGVPQGRHLHNLMSAGARAIDDLLPGTIDALVAAGGHRIDVPRRYLSYAFGVWNHRYPSNQLFVSASRPLLDFVVRQRIPGTIEYVEGTDVIGLTGGADKVTGALARDRETRSTRELAADFVVDATGRSSGTPGWLAELGLPAVPEERFGVGIAYASRTFQSPPGAVEEFPVIGIGGIDDPYSRGGVLMPIEQGRWMVTVAGLPGGEPPTDEDGFLAFARNLSHPLLADLMAGAEPLGPVAGHRTADNRRRRYDTIRPWPEGFVVVGDAVSAFNPIYGHGMTVAARNALSIRNGLRRHGNAAGTARIIQASVTSGGLDAWQLAVGQDIRSQQVLAGEKPDLKSRLLYAYADRMGRVARRRPDLFALQLDVYTLTSPASRVFSPRAALATLLGPTAPPLLEPPFTAAERRALA